MCSCHRRATHAPLPAKEAWLSPPALPLTAATHRARTRWRRKSAIIYRGMLRVLSTAAFSPAPSTTCRRPAPPRRHWLLHPAPPPPRRPCRHTPASPCVLDAALCAPTGQVGGMPPPPPTPPATPSLPGRLPLRPHPHLPTHGAVDQVLPGAHHQAVELSRCGGPAAREAPQCSCQVSLVPPQARERCRPGWPCSCPIAPPSATRQLGAHLSLPCSLSSQSASTSASHLAPSTVVR